MTKNKYINGNEYNSIKRRKNKSKNTKERGYKNDKLCNR